MAPQRVHFFKHTNNEATTANTRSAYSIRNLVALTTIKHELIPECIYSWPRHKRPRLKLWGGDD